MPLPIVPGWLLVAVGLGVLAPEVEWADRLVKRFKPDTPVEKDEDTPHRQAA